MESIFIFSYIYVFVVGTCVASFINVVIYRVPLGLNFAKGRSFCPSCHNTLKPYDMIPVLSWFVLRGKCRFCGEKISFRYPVIEFIGGILAVVCFHHYQFDGMTLISFAFSIILLAIFMIDYDIMIIPNGLVICCLVIAVVSIPFMHVNMVDRIIGFFAISAPLYLLNLIIPDAFGGGDIKLLAVCGFFLGWSMILVGMFIAVVLAGCYAGYLLITHKVETGGHIAFGPYICVGIFIALLYGQDILNMYLHLFGL